LKTDVRKKLGDFGERYALNHLQKQGYKLIAKNYRCKAGEIDLIAKEGGDIVFIEVRTRKGRGFGTPEESVNRLKQAKLIQVAQSYLEAANQENAGWRIDVVAIEMFTGGTLKRVAIIKNAVQG
jgi:putative endonuclease